MVNVGSREVGDIGLNRAPGLRALGLAAAFAVLLGACAPEESQDTETQAAPEPSTFEWKLVTTWPKNLPGLGTAPERLAEMVDVMSAGRLKIKVYAANELVPAFEVFDAVSEGSAEMGHGAAYYWRGKAPIAAIFATVPFGLTAQEMNAWLYHGGGLELWRELYGRFGVVPMAAGNSGVQMAGWFNKEINTPADLQGLKMRIPGLGGEVFQRAGGVAVSLPGSEIFTSLQTGVIDATEWVGPYNDLAFGFQEIARYYYYPGWHEPGPTIEAIVNADALGALPDDLRTILETACRAINQDMLDEFTARNADSLRTLVEEHDVEIRRLPDEVIDEFRRLSAEVLVESAGDDDELSQRILDSYAEFLNKMRAYHAVTEQAYLNAR